MTEENNVSDWQAPPPPELIKKEEPEMSEVATLFNIFIEPGRTFEDLRKKPRFILATLILSILATAFAFGLYYKVGDAGYRNFVREQVEKQAPNATGEQLTQAIDLQMSIQSVVRYILPLFIIVAVIIGGLFYFLLAKAFGGNGGFLHGVSVWVYSAIPPAIISSIINAIVLVFKSVDDIDIAASQRGLVQANLSLLVNGKAMPVVATLLSFIDLFAIWGWILASIGLQKTNKISSSSAWAITIILALVGMGFRILGAVFSGNPS